MTGADCFYEYEGRYCERHLISLLPLLSAQAPLLCILKRPKYKQEHTRYIRRKMYMGDCKRKAKHEGINARNARNAR